jgi:hypothetical protein
MACGAGTQEAVAVSTELISNVEHEALLAYLLALADATVPFCRVWLWVT